MRGKDQMKPRYVLRDLILSRGGRVSKADIRNSRRFRGWEWKDIYDLVFQLRKEFRALVGKYGQEAWEIIGDDVVGLEDKLTMREREKIAQRTHASKIGSSELTIQQNLILKGRYKAEGLKNGVISALDLSSKHLGLIIKSSTDVKEQAIRFEAEELEAQSAIESRPGFMLKEEYFNLLAPFVSKLSRRVLLQLYRGYLVGEITKPINELSDEELGRVYGIGQKALAEIHQAVSKEVI